MTANVQPCSKEMQAIIDSITDFPLDLPGQRAHYRKVWIDPQGLLNCGRLYGRI